MPETLAAARELRGEAQASGPAQPNMYFCIDTPELRIIAIDTGILGPARLTSRASGCAASRPAPKPKLLISGKPVYAGDSMSPRRILGSDRRRRRRRSAVDRGARSRQQLRGDDRRRRASLRAPQRARRRRPEDRVRDLRRRRRVHDFDAPDPSASTGRTSTRARWVVYPDARPIRCGPTRSSCCASCDG